MAEDSNNYSTSTIIGIDLGTTNSCVGVWKNGKVEILKKKGEDKTTPSYVAFTKAEIYVGEAAKDSSSRNPPNAVFDIQRLIGRQFDDPLLQKDMKLWPFVVVQGENSKPVIEIKNESGTTQRFHPEEILALLLSYLKKTAESYLGREVKEAIITVPAYYNQKQRQALIDVGTIIGLKICRFIVHSTAAAITYALEVDGDKKSKRNVLIFDLGGCTLDVSLVKIEDRVVEVIATSGDTHLGGEDFTNLLVERSVDEFLKKTGTDIRDNAKAIKRLRTKCEIAQRVLASNQQAKIIVDALGNGEDFSTTITRPQFEELCLPLLKKCIEIVEKVVKDSNLGNDEVKDIVLAGGTTRMPKILELLKQIFKAELSIAQYWDNHAVAQGAAVLAGIQEKQIKENDIVVLQDTAFSLALGIETLEGVKQEMSPISLSQFSASEMEEMIQKVKRINDETQIVQERWALINNTQNFAHDIKHQLNFQKTKDALSAVDLKTLGDKVVETLQWLDDNQAVEVDLYKAKYKELEEIFSFIVEKIESKKK